MGKEGKQHDVDHFFFLGFSSCFLSFLFFSLFLMDNIYKPYLIHSRKKEAFKPVKRFILFDYLVRDACRIFALVHRKCIPLCQKICRRRKECHSVGTLRRGRQGFSPTKWLLEVPSFLLTPQSFRLEAIQCTCSVWFSTCSVSFCSAFTHITSPVQMHLFKPIPFVLAF